MKQLRETFYNLSIKRSWFIYLLSCIISHFIRITIIGRSHSNSESEANWFSTNKKFRRGHQSAVIWHYWFINTEVVYDIFQTEWIFVSFIIKWLNLVNLSRLCNETAFVIKITFLIFLNNFSWHGRRGNRDSSTFKSAPVIILVDTRWYPASKNHPEEHLFN